MILKSFHHYYQKVKAFRVNFKTIMCYLQDVLLYNASLFSLMVLLISGCFIIKFKEFKAGTIPLPPLGFGFQKEIKIVLGLSLINGIPFIMQFNKLMQCILFWTHFPKRFQLIKIHK